MAVVVQYFVQRKLRKGEKVQSSVFVITESILRQHGRISRSLLLKCMPLSGNFHLRAKFFDDTNTREIIGSAQPYYWLDLTNDKIEVPTVNGMVYLKCLPTGSVEVNQGAISNACNDWHANPDELAAVLVAVDNPDVRGTTMARVGASVSNAVSSGWNNFTRAARTAFTTNRDSSSSFDRSSNEESSRQKMTKARQSVAKGFNTISKGIKDIGSFFGKLAKARKASQNASMVVHSIHFDRNTPVSFKDPTHEKELTKLWVILNSCRGSKSSASVPFAAQSDTWTLMGFASPMPEDEINEAGVLGLKCLVYMADNYKPILKTMIKAQLPQQNHNFQVASVAISLVVGIGQLIGVDVGDFREPAPNVFWKLFEKNVAFFELFAVALTYFSFYFKTDGKMDFSASVRGVLNKIEALLKSGPTNVKDMKSKAARMGILYI